MFDPRPLDDTISVAPQIAAADLPAIHAAGFRTIINNRPDHEEPGQPAAADLRAAAEAAGLAWHDVPVGPAGIGPAELAATAAALAGGPTLAFCRSGARSCQLWAFAQARAGDDPAALIAKAAAAGYDLRGLAPTLTALSAR